MKKKKNRRRIDMAALPPPSQPEPIPDTFENVIKALVKPVAPKKTEKPENTEGDDHAASAS